MEIKTSLFAKMKLRERELKFILLVWSLFSSDIFNNWMFYGGQFWFYKQK